VEYAASHIQPYAEALTEMNLQLHHVVADITGAPACASFARSLPASAPPEALAGLRHYSCHLGASAETIAKALTVKGELPHRASFWRSSRRSPCTTLTNEKASTGRTDRKRVERINHP